MKEFKTFLLISMCFLSMISCTSLKKPCEKQNYSYEVLEIIPEGYTRAERVSSTIYNILKESTGIVNLIIKGNSQSAAKGITRLVPIISPVDLDQVRCDGIPVYWVMNSNSPPCEVPKNKKVIVVDQMFPELYSQTFYAGTIVDTLQLLKLSHLLAISLLHELGHLINKDFEKYSNWEDILKGDSLNTEPTQTKAIEQSADDFAAFEILRACQDESNYSRRAMGFILGNAMQLAIYNLNRKRQEEIQRGLYTAPTDYYKDKGYTHINLDLRYRQIYHMATMGGGSSITEFHKYRNDTN